MFGDRYQDLLERILSRQQLDGTTNQSYLKQLIPAAEQLWQSFQDPSKFTDYGDPKVQDAYLLRYFLPYAYLTWYVIDRLKVAAETDVVGRDDSVFEACLFGCGPAPEILGLVGTSDHPGVAGDLILVSLFDIHIEEWRHSHGLVLPALLPDGWDTNSYEIFTERVVLDSPDISESVINRLAAADLVLFQNCMNELIRSSSKEVTVQSNVEKIFESMTTGSWLIFIDFGGYVGASTTRFLESFVPDLNRAHYIHEEGECDVRSIRAQLPNEIFDAGLYVHKDFRRNQGWKGCWLKGAFRYNSFAVQR